MELNSEEATAASGATGQLGGLREVGPQVIQWGKQSGAGGVSFGQLGALEKGTTHQLSRGETQKETQRVVQIEQIG